MKSMLFTGNFCNVVSKKCPYALNYNITGPFCGYFSEELATNDTGEFVRCLSCLEVHKIREEDIE
jgi:hypothetical protein